MTLNIVGAPGVQTDIANGDMILTFYDRTDVDHFHPAAVVRVPASQVESIIRDVTNIGLQLLAQALVAVSTGECETCHNVGMVDEPRPYTRGGGSWRVHCPTCGPRKTAEAVLRDMPRVVPSGFRTEHIGIGSALITPTESETP